MTAPTPLLCILSGSLCLSACAQANPPQPAQQVAHNQTQSQMSSAPASQNIALGKQPVTFTSAQYKAAIAFDYQGENGKLQFNPAQPSVGYPCGVPNNYAWKYGTKSVANLAEAITGRGKQQAAAAYNQIYNACGKRRSVPNARIELTDLVVQYYSKKQGKWVGAVKQPVGGAAFAEDFVNNQATQADIRNEAHGHKSVRSGIGNAASQAGGGTGRSVNDGPVGYNFHGFANRFNMDWSDVRAIVVSQAMRCIPNTGTDLKDCKKLGYLANVGLDSWASINSSFDNFKTHGGVSGGRFKPVTTSWQIFTNYIGPWESIPTPPVPQF